MREISQPEDTGASSGVGAQPSRRHAAIAFVDIVGYTTLMALDGERTHACWMLLLGAVLEPLAAAQGGRIVKSTGDGVAVEFVAPGLAWAWARAVQDHVLAHDAPEQPPIAFRIAIAAGEIDATERDIYGHCVNVAARLQEHAPPGGIVMTEEVRNALSDPPPMHDLGGVGLRNMPEVVRAWVVDPTVAPRTPIGPARLDLPGIAVMPFDLGQDDESDRHLANGLIEDIVVSLGSLRDLAVIARGATLAWAGTPKDPRVVGRMLGVRYLLIGTLRRGPGRLRLTVDLRETEEGDSLWSDRIDLEFADLFDVQDAIVQRVVTGIAPSVRAAEVRRALRRRPDSLSAYDLTLRGMCALDGLQRTRFGDAGMMLHRAIEEDPGFAMPVAWASQWHSLAVGQAWTATPEVDAALAGDLAQRSVQLDPRNALGFAMCGHHRAYHQRDPEAALPFFDRALTACPNHALSWTLRSASLSYLGRGPEALDAARRGHALWPHGPERYYFEFFVGLAEYACGNFAEAARWTRLSLADNPGFTSAHKALMASLVALGRDDDARQVAADMMALDPTFKLSAYAAERVPIVDPVLRAHLVDHMRRAGVPD
jgi:adenylate cyclase